MRRMLAILVAISLGSMFAGCSSSSSNKKNPQPTEEPQQTMSWTLSIKSKCDDSVPDDQCVAAHGFAVKTDGYYQIGPGPGSSMKAGILTPEEAKSLDSALANTLTASHQPMENHETTEPQETEDTVTLSRGGNPEEILVQTKGTEFAYFTASSEEAKNLYKIMKTLAAKYYTLPFPDACADGAAGLIALYRVMQSCNQDSDCAYFDEFEPISPGNVESLTTDDCSIVPPLAVANASSVQTNKAKLQEGLEQIRAACGDRIARPDCSEVTTLHLSGAAPQCQQGACVLKSGS